MIERNLPKEAALERKFWWWLSGLFIFPNWLHQIQFKRAVILQVKEKGSR